jgi:predicted nucleic acid-binding protein
MKVLVDTSVWSLGLRRPKGVALGEPQRKAVSTLSDLVQDGRAVLLGAIRQELLSGIRLQTQFDALQSALAAFDDVPLGMQDYTHAAQFFNLCRANGVQGSNTDFLICAAAVNHDVPIFTLDQDFENYQKWLPIRLYAV